jgi:multiple RNA-binding domain-containing protein 1
MAFVLYILPESASKAITALDGVIFQGRLLHILPARLQKSYIKEDPSYVANFKKQKEVERKQKSQVSNNWNSLIMGVS